MNSTPNLKSPLPRADLAALDNAGWLRVTTDFLETDLLSLRAAGFTDQRAGLRCLLDDPVVGTAANRLRTTLVQAGYLRESSIAVQAIAFDKTPATNWKVSWHQDLMFPFARPVVAEGFDLPSVKDGINYARPPQQVLQELLAVRLHLDDCDETNGPLRVSPGSHRHGVLKHTELSKMVELHGVATCLAKSGDALLMRPLLLHASSSASSPKNRRVLHFVYYSGLPIGELWYRCLK